jgi:hypothetical protein
LIFVIINKGEYLVHVKIVNIKKFSEMDQWLHCVDLQHLHMADVGPVLMVTGATAIVDIIDPLVPMVVDLLNVQLIANKVDKSKLFNFRSEIRMHQSHLIIVVKEEVLVHDLSLAGVIRELQRLLLDLKLRHCDPLNSVLPVEDAGPRILILAVEVQVDLCIQIYHN